MNKWTWTEHLPPPPLAAPPLKIEGNPLHRSLKILLKSKGQGLANWKCYVIDLSGFVFF